MSEWTSERIAELRRLHKRAVAGDVMSVQNFDDAAYQHMPAVLDEIERLRARVAELEEARAIDHDCFEEDEIAALEMQERDQRRERLLRECAVILEAVESYGDRPFLMKDVKKLRAALCAELGEPPQAASGGAAE